MDERKEQYLKDERERLFAARDKGVLTEEERDELMAERNAINLPEDTSTDMVVSEDEPQPIDTPAVRRRSNREPPSAQE